MRPKHGLGLIIKNQETKHKKQQHKTNKPNDDVTGASSWKPVLEVSCALFQLTTAALNGDPARIYVELLPLAQVHGWAAE